VVRAECVTRVTRQTGKLNERSRTVLSSLAVNSKSERKVNLLPSLGFEPETDVLGTFFTNQGVTQVRELKYT
jgi:hypothetical protein